ncbi:hypothetical protein A0256_17090 [Mucilaginibacter sp. PAMC 26640]|nr:hypothetical protein A0256_17090 [Mucilaginibacter sp. PAMC 26640]
MKYYFLSFSKAHFFSQKEMFMLLGLLMFSFHASAQTDTIKKLKEIQVKAKFAPNVQTLVPTQVLNQKDFAGIGAFNVADAVRNFTGVNIKDYGGIGGLKTISVRSLGASHTAVLFDGVQLNDAQNGQIDLSKFNLINVQDIVLYNGQPESLLQPARSFASASVLSIKTTQPILTPAKPYQIQAGVKGGTFGLINPYLQWQQRISSQWSFIANGNYIQANGQYKFKVDGDRSDTLAIRKNGDVKSLQSDAALYWTKNDSNKFNIHINYYNAKRGLPGAIVYYNPATGQRLNNEDLFGQATYQHTWLNGLALLLNSKVSQLKTSYYDPNFLNAQGFITQHYKQREYYQSAALAYHLLPNWEISCAIDASRVNVDADIYNYASPTRFTLLNVLASNYKIGRWIFHGNLLQTNLSETVKSGTASRSQSILSPTLMASVKPFAIQNLQFRAFYKNVFRAPTLDELYFFAFVPRTIKPEFVKEYDLGFTWSKNLNNLLEYVTVTTDAYYNDVTNKIQAIPNQNPAIFSFSNLGKVNIRGVDLGIKTQSRHFNRWSGSLSANYTYQQAQDVSNPGASTYLGQIAYTPKNTLALNGGLNHGNLGVYYNYLFSSSRYYTGNNDPQYKLPVYAISDASAVYRLMSGHIPLLASIEVNNLFNKNYAVIRSFPMPGRSYRFSIQITI